MKGTVIIIRDKAHALKKKNSKINNYDEDDVDYEQLMAEGNVIIIKDDETK